MTTARRPSAKAAAPRRRLTVEDGPEPLRFTPHQIADLRKLGVTNPQLSDLEDELPSCRFLLAECRSVSKT